MRNAMANTKRDDANARRPRTGCTNDESKDEGGDIRHIVDTGLPPGIDIEDAKDPGNSPKSPATTRRK